MTGNTSGGVRVLGSLGSADGFGTVRIEDRFDTDIDEVWSALTEPERLARWYGEIEGELRVEDCEPPRRFVVVSRGVDEANEVSTEVRLTINGDQTALVVEKRGLPVDLLWVYGAGNQIHVEDLAAHIAGGDRTDAKTRFDELAPAYRDLATKIS
jgi:hypothetical protein